MLPQIDLFVLDEGRGYGPVSIEKIRTALTDGSIGPSARFRVSEGHPWLPGATWDPLADLFPAPSLPEPPTGKPSPLPPADVAELPAKVRELLRWFVADDDGVMGPVGGDFVVKGIKAGKISSSAAVALAARRVRAEWVLAPVVFPRASAAATTLRRRGAPAPPCPYCRETLMPGADSCASCGEPTRPPLGPNRREQVLAVGAAIATAALVGLGAAVFVRGRVVIAEVAPPPAPAASAAPAVAPAAAAADQPGPWHLGAAETIAALSAPPGSTPLELLALSDDGGVAIAVEGSGGGADGVLAIFATAARPARRIQLQERPAAIAVAADGSFGAALLRSRGEVMRIDLGPRAALAAPGPRVHPCAEPTHLAIGAGAVLVTCRAGDVVLLDAASLATLATLSLGGPPLDLALAPDRAQALVAVGQPAQGAAVIDLDRRRATPVASGEPIEAVRYAPDGRAATAIGPRLRRILVLR